MSFLDYKHWDAIEREKEGTWELAYGNVRVWCYWKFLHNPLWRNSGLLEVSQHLLRCRLFTTVRCCNLHCMIFCPVSSFRNNVSRNLTIFQLLQHTSERLSKILKKDHITHLQDCHWNPNSLVVPNCCHPTFAGNNTHSNWIWTPFRGLRGICGRRGSSFRSSSCTSSKMNGNGFALPADGA